MCPEQQWCDTPTSYLRPPPIMYNGPATSVYTHTHCRHHCHFNTPTAPPSPPFAPKADKSSSQHPRAAGIMLYDDRIHTESQAVSIACVRKRVCIEDLRNRQVNTRGGGCPVCLGPDCHTRVVWPHVRGLSPPMPPPRGVGLVCCLSTLRRATAQSGLQVSQYLPQYKIPGSCIAACCKVKFPTPDCSALRGALLLRCILACTNRHSSSGSITAAGRSASSSALLHW